MTLAGPAVALVALIFGAYQYLERRRQQLLLDLQGGKEAVASAAARVRNGDVPRRFPKARSTRHRRELFEALCLAAVFESSGRSRSLIYDAMSSVMKNERYRVEIHSIVKRLSTIVSRNTAFTNLNTAVRRVEILRAALGLDGDVRIRIGRLDAVNDGPSGLQVFDWRLPKVDALRPAALRPVIKQLDNIVLVAPHVHSGISCTISLDYHRYAWAPDSAVKTPPAATGTGRLVISGKYEGTELQKQVGPDVVNILANNLAMVVKLNPAYLRASAIAIVPGSSRDFSNRLGAQVASLTGIRSVLLRRLPEVSESSHARGSAEMHFYVPSPVEGCVIVLDDVYRTGRTLDMAATALKEAGAQQVLGLTATCTISPIVDNLCGHDMLIRSR
jgi:hypothetical protein